MLGNSYENICQRELRLSAADGKQLMMEVKRFQRSWNKDVAANKNRNERGFHAAEDFDEMAKK